METIKLNARAKLNWTLDVLRKRDDGYHDLESLMQSIELFDTLTITLGSGSVDVICEYPYAPNGDANIACKSAELILKKAGSDMGAHIHIKKRIPVAAGLAGGSTDAAGVLVGINYLLGEPFTRAELAVIGAEIGADVPFCVTGGLQLAEGVGERLNPITPGAPFHLVLVKPECRASTENVYQSLNLSAMQYHPDNPLAMRALQDGDAYTLGSACGNVLRTVTQAFCPQLEELADRLDDQGALCVNMTGSGPTMYGLFEDFEQALSAMRSVRHSDAEWCCAVSTASEGITILE